MIVIKRSCRVRPGLVCSVAALAFTLAGAGAAVAQAPDPGVPGRTVDELLTLVRRVSPEIAVMALEAEAAVARVDAAGELPDPLFRTEFENIDRRSGSLLPSRLGLVTYTIAQEFPLWGKRDLRREAARAEADGAQARRRSVESELAMRVKAAFTGYYQANTSIQITEELLGTIGAVVAAAQRRYAQGRGSQQDVIKAEIERGQLRADLVRLGAARNRAVAQLNALLNRPAGAPLATPRALRPLPPPEAISLAFLVERVKQSNPGLAGERAGIDGAERARRLVDRSWYPDVTVSLSAVDEDRRFAGYEAMIEFKLPLRWGLREAQAREASAKLGAAQARLDAASARAQGELEEAYWALDASRRVARILHETHIPQTQLALRTARAAYEVGRGDLLAVLEAERNVRQVLLEHLNVLAEQQIQLAEIEKIIGGDL